MLGVWQTESCVQGGGVGMTEPKLKPCPFCGCKSISMFEHRDYDGAFFVMCDSCGATLGAALDNMALTEEEITDLWNTRVVQNDKL